MWGTGQADVSRHGGHLHSPQHTADITYIGLNNINGSPINDSLPSRQITILLPSSHIERKRFRDFSCLFDLPIGTGLFEMLHPILLK